MSERRNQTHPLGDLYGEEKKKYKVTVNFRLADTPLLRTPRCCGHFTITDTPLLRTSRYYGQPAITDTPLLRTGETEMLETTSHYCGFPLLRNRPLPSYLVPLFQNESSFKTFDMKMSLIFMKMNM